MRDNILISWEDFIANLIDKSYFHKKQGISYNYSSVVWHLGSLDGDISFINKVYPGKEAKKSYLMNAYFNKESLIRAKQRLSEKKNTSVNISLINKEKTNTAQDHCMVSMVVFKENKKYRATIFYRTTELCRKFLFDLKFIQEEILTTLEIPNCDITFMFAKLTISYAFLHTPFLLDSEYIHTLKLSPLGREFWEGYLQYLNKMLLIKQRGSTLKSHWRHFQTFKNSEVFPVVMKYLEGISYAGTNRFSNKDTSES